MDREKLRQIKRPNQVKVIFMNSCPLLSDLPMIIPTSQKGKKTNKKTKTKDPLKYFSCLQRKQNLFSTLQSGCFEMARTAIKFD